ncbi:MAG: SoxR reducing system RseC family protein [Bacillota bacterium]|nr:SoxR reducing system RseC family protein [Bacillota bacterium]
MEQLGTILESHNGKARVLVRRPGACARCGACELGARPEQVIELPNPRGYPPGTTVRLVVGPGEVARASFTVYVIPLAALLIGFAAGELLGRWTGHPSELLVFVTGILFLLLSYRLLFLWDRRTRRTRCTPAMEAVFPGEPASSPEA